MEPHVTNPSVLLLVTMAQYVSSLMCVSAQKDGQEVSAKQQSASHPVKMEEFVQGQKCVAVLRGGKDADAPYVPAQNFAKMEGTVQQNVTIFLNVFMASTFMINPMTFHI
jgi:hypothetical protein